MKKKTKNIFLIFALFIMTIQVAAFAKEESTNKEAKNQTEKNIKTEKEDTTKNEKKAEIKNEKNKSDSPTNTLSTKSISETMAIQWCQKLNQCAPDSGMKSGECRRVLKESFLEGFERIAQGHQVNISQEQLSQCVLSLNSSSCEQLQNAQNLRGCEFITYLNRQ